MLDKQIRVMEETLIPLIRAVGHNIRTDSSMWTKLSELVEELRQVDRHALTAPTGARKTVQPLQAQPPKDLAD